MAIWRCQRLHWNWYYLYLPSRNIQFSKFYCWKSNNSLNHWEDDVYLRDLFLPHWFLLSTFSWIQWKCQKFSEDLLPRTRWGARSSPPNSQPIIAIAARSFTQNSKKTRTTNFSLFRPLKGRLSRSKKFVI